MNVLSLFNGMSFGYMALQSSGKSITNYYSSEIDKYANQATQAMFPDVVQLGDVTKWKEWDIDLGSIDLLLAGFPCQAWSMAGKQKGDDDPRGALVHDLIAIWSEIKKHNPHVKFMFENVKMKKEFLDYINDLFGVEPICINSSLVSAQDRERYYWTNISDITQPADKKLTINDIIKKENIIEVTHRLNSNGGEKTKGKIIKNCRSINDKHKTLLTGGIRPTTTGGCHFEIGNRWFQFLPEGAMMLQTVPEHHINTLLNSGISNTQLYKIAGNGWTHDVITHIFDAL